MLNDLNTFSDSLCILPQMSDFSPNISGPRLWSINGKCFALVHSRSVRTRRHAHIPTLDVESIQVSNHLLVLIHSQFIFFFRF
nr:hypothetical protein Iba_chr12eCG2550 [Ipomoea batatas]